MASFAAAFLVTACSSNDGPKYPDANSFCNARAEAECSGEVIKACAVPDATHCVAKRQAACIAAMPAGTSYNAGGAEACIQAVSSSYSDAKVSAQENAKITSTCARVFDGTGQANATCKTDTDCKISQGLRCVLRGGSDEGTCQVPQQVQGGGVCSAPSQLCITDFHCGSTQHCDINSQAGEPCSALQPCVVAARCTTSGMCEKKFDDGAPCMRDEECSNALCARGTGSAQGLCVSQMILAPNEPFCVDAR